MKRRIFLLGLIFCCLGICAQTENFTRLDWNVLRIDSVLPVYTEVIPLESDYTQYDYEVKVEYPQYEPLTAEEVKVVIAQDTTLQEHPIVQCSVGVSRKQGLLEINFIPVVCRNDRYFRLVSCKIVIYKTVKPVAARAKAPHKSARERYARTSVLSQGRWVKIRVSDEGVYQLTRSALSAMGFSNPDNVRLYGYGGHVQDEVIRADTDYDDLEEVPLYKTAAGWLFYANGLVSWNRSVVSSNTPRHKTNPYSSYAYYFLTEADRPATFPREASSQNTVRNELTSFPDFVLYEKDEYAWYTGGRSLFEAYNYADGNSRTYTLPAVNPVSAEGGTLLVAFTASANSSTQVTPTINGVAQPSFSVDKLTEYSKAMSQRRSYRLTTLNQGSAGTVVKLTTTAGHNARLDFLELSYTRSLLLSGSYLAFSHNRTGTSRFNITRSGGQNVSVWRLGEPGDPVTEIEGTQSGSVYSVVVDDATRRYVAVDVNASFPAPEVVGQVANQNLHGTDTIVDMVIIVPASGKLTAQARRLAEAHALRDGLHVQVVRADQIYNEFSSGTPDATAYRRYMKMLYDRAETAEQAPRYLLLFGDAAWDNRMLSSAWRTCRPDDFLLCYESENSVSETNCYVMEDYFGLLDDGEGARPTSGDKPDLGIGRFPVRTAEEARIMVDKTLDYLEGAHAGLWKNIVCIMGDDGNVKEHMDMADQVADNIERYNPELEVRKIMWDAYPRESSTTGNRYPLAKQKIYQQIEEGALMMNYTGHGITYCLSDEQVMRLDDFRAFSSLRMPLWVTAACTVMPFDTQTENIGEAAVLNEKGAAVAFYGTARTVYANLNLQMNKAFTRFLFGKDDRGRRNRLGDAVRLAKNFVGSNINHLHYALLGDPALVIGAPLNKVVLDSINGRLLAEDDVPCSLKAGSLVRFSGHIADAGGALMDGFTGVLSSRLFDKESTVTCLNQAKKTADEKPFTFQSRDKVLFHGSDSVRNGRFDFTFVVPVDISYSNEGGRVVFYAVSDDRQQEANGYSEEFLIGGSSDEMAADTEGPRITAYLNSEDFPYGGKVNATPYFVAALEDESGINTTNNGIGHNLELVIDGNPKTTYNLNDYYINEFGDFRRGTVAFSIPALAPGVHSLQFRAWDVLNNYSTTELAFQVDPSLRPHFASLSVTNNPAREQTTFLFRYDRPGSTCTFTIEVFDLSGRLLWTHTENGANSTGTYAIPWNLTTGGGMPLSTGVYLYRATLSCEGSKEATQTQKLVISRNK